MYQQEWQENFVCGYVGRSFSRGFLDLPQDDCTIRKGRNEMANALRNNQLAPLQCAWYAPTTMDVELRAVMYQDVSGTSSWSVTAWLGTLDLLGWGLEDEKMIYLQYVVNGDDLMVTGYSEISLSQNIHMNKLTPNAEGIDLLLVNGNQFDSLVLLNSTYEKNDDFVNGFYTESRRLQTSEEDVMLFSRAILALNLLGYPSASQWTLQRALSYRKQRLFNTEVQGTKFTV